jgi:N-acetylglutamate synthase-like GNAT family acetyltransferase
VRANGSNSRNVNRAGISKPRWFNPAGLFIAMKPYEIHESGLLISDDPALLNRALIFGFLRNRSYWAREVTQEIVDRSVENSLCFGIYLDGRQIGFARVVTDFATFAWLADVFIVEEKRGHGFSKKLVAAVLAHPRLQELRRFMLGTKDAHGLYAQFGFKPLAHPERFMEIRSENSYKCGC